MWGQGADDYAKGPSQFAQRAQTHAHLGLDPMRAKGTMLVSQVSQSDSGMLNDCISWCLSEYLGIPELQELGSVYLTFSQGG